MGLTAIESSPDLTCEIRAPADALLVNLSLPEVHDR